MDFQFAETSLRRLCVQLSILTLLTTPLLATAGEIRIGGTGNALGTMRLLGEAFSKAYPDSKIVVLSSLGTSGAFKGVPKGAIEIGLSSRRATESETQAGIQTQEYARSLTVFAVRADNKTGSLNKSQIADIYAGRLTTWPDGTTVRPVMRQAGDDNTRQIRALSPDIDKALVTAEQRSGLAYAATDQEAADKMESIQGSLGVTTVALIRSEKRNLRAVALDGIEPTPENASNGRYPLLKHFYFVLPKSPSAETELFLKFVRSAKGADILRQTGHLLP